MEAKNSPQCNRIDEIAGDNHFYYLYLLSIFQTRASAQERLETQGKFLRDSNECYNQRTGYFTRKDSKAYPNASILEMSMDELMAISQMAPSFVSETVLRRLTKFRGFYASHLRNRTFLGGFLGLWCALKLNAEGYLSFPWKVAFTLTVFTTNWGSPGSKLLTLALIHKYTLGAYNENFIMQKAVDYAKKKLNEEGIENIVNDYWKTSSHPTNVLTDAAKGFIV